MAQPATAIMSPKTMKLGADDVLGVVIPGAGHWVAEEASAEMLAVLTPSWPHRLPTVRMPGLRI